MSVPARLMVLSLVTTTSVLATTFLPVSSQSTSTSITGSMGGASQPLSPSQRDLGAWTDINIKARECYASWRQRHRDAFGPLIIMKGEDLTLIRNGKRQSTNVIPSDYSMLKSIAHIPLAVFALSRDFTGKPLESVRIDDLRKWKDVFLTGRADLAKWKPKFSAKTYERQIQMIDSAAAFIDKAVSEKTISARDLRRYSRQNSRWVLANVDEAIASQLAAIDKQVSQWRDDMPSAEWDKTNAIVFGFHMPRKENSASQYFLSLFGQKEEGERLIYVEGPSYEDDYGIELLATHVIDKQIAIDFFNDKWRMHRDLLSDGARKYLKKHPPAAR